MDGKVIALIELIRLRSQLNIKFPINDSNLLLNGDITLK